MNTKNSNSRHCLVTGGAGFIGCAMSAELANHFDRVVVLDNLHPQIHKSHHCPDALDRRCELVIGDVTDVAAWDGLLTGFKPDVVVHLAAETGTGQSLTESARHALVNVVGTAQMLDALHRHGCEPRSIVLSSSRAVYGEGEWRRSDGTLIQPGQRTQQQLEAAQWNFPDAIPLAFAASSTRTAPTSIYGGTKLAQEHLISAWALAHQTVPRILRLQNVYGPGQSLSNPYTGIVSLFVRLAKQGVSIPLYEDGEMNRDFVFIDDVAAALLAAATNHDASTAILDVGTGEATSIRQVAEAIAERYGAPAPHVCGKFRNGDVRHATCEISATKSALKWTPKVDWREGLARLCAWIDQEMDATSSGSQGQ